MTAFTLPPYYRRALTAATLLVPAAEREGWRRLWHAELWHAAHQRPALSRTRTCDLTLGLLSDAAWLRAESLRLRFSGSPLLCLAALVLPCAIAAAFAFRLSGLDSVQLFLAQLLRQLRERFLAAAVIALVAQFALPREGRAPAVPGRSRTIGALFARFRRSIQRSVFFTAKIGLVATLAFLLGVNLVEAVPGLYLVAFPQIYLTAVMLAVALRWATLDHKRRCQHCLHTLTSPARIGRPSHNFLEWNGTERTCRHGHGALHQPEMQTSWLESNRWVIT